MREETMKNINKMIQSYYDVESDIEKQQIVMTLSVIFPQLKRCTELVDDEEFNEKVGIIDLIAN